MQRLVLMLTLMSVNVTQCAGQNHAVAAAAATNAAVIATTIAATNTRPSCTVVHNPPATSVSSSGSSTTATASTTARRNRANKHDPLKTKVRRLVDDLLGREDHNAMLTLTGISNTCDSFKRLEAHRSAKKTAKNAKDKAELRTLRKTTEYVHDKALSYLSQNPIDSTKTDAQNAEWLARTLRRASRSLGKVHPMPDTTAATISPAAANAVAAMQISSAMLLKATVAFIREVSIAPQDGATVSAPTAASAEMGIVPSATSTSTTSTTPHATTTAAAAGSTSATVPAASATQSSPATPVTALALLRQAPSAPQHDAAASAAAAASTVMSAMPLATSTSTTSTAPYAPGFGTAFQGSRNSDSDSEHHYNASGSDSDRENPYNAHLLHH